jgi:hypothetical protein
MQGFTQPVTKALNKIQNQTELHNSRRVEEDKLPGMWSHTNLSEAVT